MNISYKWLKEYVDFTLTAEEVLQQGSQELTR